jgi:glutathione S-transferase
MKFYGSSKSRAARSLWALEEVGAKYEHDTMPNTQAKTPDHLKRNPNGHIPVLEDDGHYVWESMAINLYVAEKYGKNGLWPADVYGHAAAYQWSFWGMTEVEPHLLAMLMHKMLLPADQRDEKAAQKAADAIKAPLKVLDDALQGREYLLGSTFTIADLNAASVLAWAPMMRLDLSATPTAAAWLQKCLGREANARVRAMK